jgi:transcriptional regulator with XRE-family HTH domain
MAQTKIQRLAAERARSLRRRLGDALLEGREATGLSLTEVAREARVDRRWLAQAERGEANLTLDALASIATVLGTEASIRLYEAEGARLRDHLQVALLDCVLERLHLRWHARLEVPVHAPSRGVIDLVLAERAGDRRLCAAEAHSEIRRVDRQLRSAGEKAESLPSADGWPWEAPTQRAARLLILRSSRATRDTVGNASALFAAAYPGRTRDAVEALTSATGGLPDAAIVWVDLRGRASRLLDGPPRGIEVGR